MEPKSVLWLEDVEETRDIITAALGDRGFRVLSAGNVDEARDLLEKESYRVDVCLLDMVLERRGLSSGAAAAGTTTGAAFGIEVKERMREHPPEFVIYSAFEHALFFQQALHLGARAYLQKPRDGMAEVVRHVRVLALRRSLFLTEAMTQTINTLAERSRSELEALVGFCKEVMARELRATLGAPFVLLVGDGDSTRCLGLPADAPEASAAYGIVQRAAFSALRDQPSVRVSDIPVDELPADSDDKQSLERLEDFSFVRLGQTDSLGISLGIRHSDPAVKFSEDAKALAATVAKLIPRAVLQPLMRLTKAFAVVHTRQRAILDAAASFCLYVGQEQVRIFDRALTSRAIAYEDLHPDLRRLVSFSEKLRTAGELLSWAGQRSRLERPPRGARPWSMRRVVTGVWEDLREELEIGDAGLVSIEGDCLVVGQVGDLQIAVARILQWLTLRALETPLEMEGKLSVTCRVTPAGDWAVVVFQDGSRRLPRELREKLFLPFESPIMEDLDDTRGGEAGIGLYLSKVLVEAGNGGAFEDRSDELDGELGHRFVMSFPLARGGGEMAF